MPMAGQPIAQLSIVMPVLNEAAIIVQSLTRLQVLRSRGVEVIVVDGGSHDATVELATPLADRVTRARRSRATQMNAGAQAATGERLLFLHSDCVLPDDADREILAVMRNPATGWGRFDVEIIGRHPMFRVISRLMNRRSRLTGIATGDQAIFVRRTWFEAIGGYPAIALMEDIALSRKLCGLGRPVCLQAVVQTSGRRWERHGIFRTIFRMWWLRLRYFLGGNPDALAENYERR
jgi:rSAM/selenodomain-associated transferase 2